MDDRNDSVGLKLQVKRSFNVEFIAHWKSKKYQKMFLLIEIPNQKRYLKMEHSNDTIQQTVNTFTLFYTALSTINGMSCHAVLLLSHLLKLLYLNKPEHHQITFGAMEAFNQLGLSQSEYKTAKQKLKELGIVSVQSNGIGLRNTIEIKLGEIATLAGLESSAPIDSADIDLILAELKDKPNSSEMCGVIRFFPKLVTGAGLSITEALIFNQLKYRSDFKKTVMYSSVRLARELACGKTKISNARQSLINKGVIATVKHGIGNHIVYKLTVKGALLSRQTLSSIPKPLAPKEQDVSTEDMGKNHLLPDSKIGNSKVNNGNPPVETSKLPSQNMPSINRAQIDKKSLGEPNQLLPPYCRSKEYSAQGLLAFIKRERWADVHLWHMTDSQVRTFTIYLETMGAQPICDENNLHTWLSRFKNSQRFNRSLSVSRLNNAT
ncbi:TPA: hypothetical protein ACVO1K_003112 [Vibrio diabolicus]